MNRRQLKREYQECTTAHLREEFLAHKAESRNHLLPAPYRDEVAERAHIIGEVLKERRQKRPKMIRTK